MAHLRQCTISLNSATAPISIPESFGGSKSLQQSGSSLPVGASVAILKGLIETVLRSGGGLQRVRANLYAALMYFMQTAPETQETKEKGVVLNLSQVLYSFICFVEAKKDQFFRAQKSWRYHTSCKQFPYLRWQCSLIPNPLSDKMFVT